MNPLKAIRYRDASEICKDLLNEKPLFKEAEFYTCHPSGDAPRVYDDIGTSNFIWNITCEFIGTKLRAHHWYTDLGQNRELISKSSEINLVLI